MSSVGVRREKKEKTIREKKNGCEERMIDIITFLIVPMFRKPFKSLHIYIYIF